MGTTGRVFGNGERWNGKAVVGFSAEICGSLSAMDKAEHAARLREAIETSRDVDRQAVADYMEVSYRTVGNWISAKSTTMPTTAQRARLRDLLGPYDAPGDAVETALSRSGLDDWRQDAVRAEYRRHLHEQRREVAG